MAKFNSFMLAVIFFITSRDSSLVSAKSNQLQVTSDGPAILGTPITFYAKLSNPDRSSFSIGFSENAPEGRSHNAMLNAENGFTSNWTLLYTEKEKVGTYSITTTVYYEIVFVYVTVATEITYYRITSTFDGQLVANQPGRYPTIDPGYVMTTNETELTAVIHDPSKYLSTAINKTFTWIQNGTIITNTTVPTLKRNFTKEGIYPMQVNLTAIFALQPNTTTTNTTNYITKYASYSLNITARIPIVNFTYTGTTWFRHGKLLELHVTCDGSSSYSYCWMIKSAPYNKTGNETCSAPSQTNDCDFEIIRYFTDPGIYTLLIIIGNDVSHFVNQSTVNIYKVNRKPQFSIIVVPISCTILAIVLVIFGVAYYWENHARYPVETADFDFGQSDEERPYTTFIDRVRDAIYTNMGSHDRDLLINPDDNSQSGVTRS